jgi:hypothetical protein
MVVMQNQYEGLTFQELVSRLKADEVDISTVREAAKCLVRNPHFGSNDWATCIDRMVSVGSHLGGLFEAFHDALSSQLVHVDTLAPTLFERMLKYNLVARHNLPSSTKWELSPEGRRFRNELLKHGGI